MELRDRQEVDMPPISPKLALEYVDFKKRYEAKDFIVTWKNIVPTYFSAEDFCSSVDEIRKKVKEITNGGQQDYKITFNMAFDYVLGNKIKNMEIDQIKCKQLVGTLMTIYNNHKFRAFTDNYTKDLSYVLMAKEKDNENKEKIRKMNKKLERENKKEQIELTKIKKKSMINKELFDMYTDYQEYFKNTKEVGYILTTEDRKEIFDNAWRDFSRDIILPNKVLQNISNEFQQKFVY